jgi:hypothetical protein
MTSDVIDQAIKKLIDRYDIDADAALALITRLSTHAQEPVTELARRLIGTLQTHRTNQKTVPVRG